MAEGEEGGGVTGGQAESKYYGRVIHEHLDGTPIFATAEDREIENTVAKELSAAWACELYRFGTLSPIDWFATRAGRLVGVLELKNRNHPCERFPTVFLNVRKWLALQLASNGLGTVPVFVVRWSDGVMRWIDIRRLERPIVQVGGCNRIVKARSDIEPVIEVPIDSMAVLK